MFGSRAAWPCSSRSRGRLGPRSAADFARRALRQNPPAVHDRDAVAILGLFHEMRRDDHRHALRRERRDPLPEIAPGQRIGAARRFVEKQYLRLVQQRRRHRQSLLVAAGQLSARQTAERAELELLDRPIDAFAPAPAAQAVRAGEEIEVVAHGKLSVQRILLGDVADSLPRRSASRADIDARHAQLAARSRQQPAQHAKRRRLAGAVGPEQPENLAAANVEIDVIDGREGAEHADQIMHFDHRLTVVPRAAVDRTTTCRRLARRTSAAATP